MTQSLIARARAAIVSKYRIDHQIGRAGVSVLPPELALDAHVVARFTREAETAAQLSHPHNARGACALTRHRHRARRGGGTARSLIATASAPDPWMDRVRLVIVTESV